MRTENSIKNSIAAITCNFISIVISFISRTFIIRYLGAELLGLDSLYINLLSILSIFDLGIGNAIVFNLYGPIKDNNVQKINSLMLFYKKTYNLIALIVFIIGICLLPFLSTIVGNITVNVNIYIAYLLFLLCTTISYLMSYKRSLIIANQKNYIINIIHTLYLIFMNTFQLLFLFFYKNYYVYLLIKLISVFLENLVISIVANKMYNKLLLKNAKKLDKSTEKNIFSRVGALLFHKVGTVAVLGTDNIIVSHYFGVVTVGIYSNYYTVINAIDTLFGQMITSLTASVGSLLLQKNTKKNFSVFDKLRFFNFWISCFSGVTLFLVLQPFVSIWIGEDYLLSIEILAVIIFNFFQKMMRKIYITFKDSAGIWKEDKMIPIFEAIINILSSILFLKIFGLIGVFLGTVFSGLIVWCYGYPKFVYKKLFDRNYKEYTIETIKYIALFIIIISISFYFSTLICVKNLLLKLIINLIISCLIPNLIMILIFRKDEKFKYFVSLITKIKRKIIHTK